MNRSAPTSQTCSQCGRLDGPKPLSVRSWTCPCGVTHDRDTNAAKNVLAQGRWDNSKPVERRSDRHPCRHRAEKQESTRALRAVPRAARRG
ncbi:zinc ribbon domain-containing protein [Micromonospora sp. NPDC023814]|uniref:zinc ribbon domain-containing protein n=1 Tax=Micromonospora sp. NPDC023814 TaxID=3154596 RepID=UPI0033D0A150